MCLQAYKAADITIANYGYAGKRIAVKVMIVILKGFYQVDFNVFFQRYMENSINCTGREQEIFLNIGGNTDLIIRPGLTSKSGAFCYTKFIK